MFTVTSSTIRIFFSYAHEDEPLRAELEKQLSVLRHDQLIEEWHDRCITPGSDWASEIDEHLEMAHIILLLVSSDFLSSEYCSGIELRRALERHQAREACVIPVLLRAVDWDKVSFNYLQALPTDARPVTSWDNRDEAFANVARGIRAVVEKLNPKARLQGDGPGQGRFRVHVPPLLPYLCDRSDQEIALGRELLLRHQKNMPRRPFVCVVHGDKDECHGQFLERLQQVSLPNLLKLKTKGLSVEEFTLPWPSSIKPERAAETFLGALDLALHDNSPAPAESMFDGVAPKRPVMVVLPLKTEDLTRGGVAALWAFVDFWNNWPDLPVDRTLICVISIRHQHIEKMGFLRRRGLRKIDEEVRRFIKDLTLDAGSAVESNDEPTPAQRYSNLCVVVLSELRAITHQEVVVWSRSSPVRAICNITEEAIDSLFERRELCTPGGPISMQLLADELENLVTKYRRR